MAADNNDKRDGREEANKAASAAMERNHEQQDKAYRQSQDNNEDAASLANDTNRPDDALTLKEQNRNRLIDQKDEDFGGEQLQ